MIYAMGLVGLCLAWLLPGHYLPWASFEQEALAGIAVAVIGLAAIASPRAWCTRIPSSALAAAILSAVPLLQWAAGQIIFFSDAVLSFTYLFGFALAVIAAKQLSAPPANHFVLAIFAAVISAAFISTGLGLAQWLQLGPFGFLEAIIPPERVSANFKQANQLASLLGLGVVGVLWMYESRRIRGAVASLGLIFIGFGMVMTQSRTGWLFVIGFGVVWLRFRRPLQLRASPVAVGFALAVFFLFVLAWGELNHWLLLSDSVSIADRLHPGRRGAIYSTVIDAVLRAPWTGYGWQQMSLAQLAATQEHVPINYWLTSAHNLVLDLVVWNGIPIGLGVATTVAWWLVTRIRGCKDLDTAALLVALGVLAVHSMLELPLHYAYYLLLAGLMAGAIEARLRAVPHQSALHLPRAVYATVWLALCAALAVVVVEYREVEESVRRARLQDAGYVQPGAAPEVPDVWLLDGPREFVRLWLSEAHTGMSPAELEWMRNVSMRYPVSDALLKYALAEALNGRELEAGRTLNLLCRVSAETRCRHAQARWLMAAKRFPQLAGVDFPLLTEAAR